MWLLLVAAGSGYLARCWQNALKARPALTDCAQIGSGSGSGSETAFSTYGSPRCGSSKEGKKSYEFRRQLSSGGKSYQAKSVGKKLVPDSCGQSCSRFSRSDDCLDGCQEGKGLIESANPHEEGKSKTGRCCGLAGSKRTEGANCLTVQTSDWEASGCQEHSLRELTPDVVCEYQEKEYPFYATSSVDNLGGEDENMFEIALLDDISTCDLRSATTTMVDGPTFQSYQKDARNFFKVPRKLSVKNEGCSVPNANGDGTGLEELVANRSGSGALTTAAGKLPVCMSIEKQAQSQVFDQVTLSQRSEGGSVSSQFMCKQDSSTHGEGMGLEGLVDTRSASGASSAALEQDAGKLTVFKFMEKQAQSQVLSRVPRMSDPGENAGVEKDSPNHLLAVAETKSSNRGQDRATSVLEVEQAEPHVASHDEGCKLSDEAPSNDSSEHRVAIAGTLSANGPESPPVLPGQMNADARIGEAGPTFESSGKVLPPFLGGKRGKDFFQDVVKNGSGDSAGSLPGKRKKDVSRGRENDAVQPLQAGDLSSGLLDPSLGCLGFDATWFEMQPDVEDRVKHGWVPRKIKASNRCSRGKGAVRKTHWMRKSPKIVSSLESCLRAQLLDDSLRESDCASPQSLTFSAYSPREEALSGVRPLERGDINASSDLKESGRTPLSDSSSRRQLFRDALGLPPLDKFVQDKESNTKDCGPCVFHDSSGTSTKKSSSPFTMKKRKTSEGCQSPSTSDFDLLPMDGLLFSFGVGVGVMSMVNESREEVEKMATILRQTESYVEHLKEELESRREPYVQGNSSMTDGSSKAMLSPIVGCGSIMQIKTLKVETALSMSTASLAAEDCGSVRSGGTVEVAQNEDQMAELEAELEAELQLMEQNLTGGSSSCHKRQFSGLSDLDLDGSADVVQGELKVNGLPRPVDPDDDQIGSPREEVQPNNWAVSPRDLDRRLRKLLITRQEESIARLELELDAAESKLICKENELQWWKDRFRKLTDLTCLPSNSGMASVSFVSSEQSIEANAFKDGSTEKAPGASREGMPIPHQANGAPFMTSLTHLIRDTNEGSSLASRTMNTFVPDGEEFAGADTQLYCEGLASETAHDDVCDEFLRAVTNTETSVCPGNEELEAISEHDSFEGEKVADSNQGAPKVIGISDPSGSAVSSTGSRIIPVLEPSESDCGSPPILRSKQISSAREWTADSRNTDETWGPIKVHSTQLDDSESTLHGNGLKRDDERGLAKGNPVFSSARNVTGADPVGRDAATMSEASEQTSYWSAGPVSRAGANTPVDSVLFKLSSITTTDALLPAAEGKVLPTSGVSVVDKVKHWEGIAKGDLSPQPPAAPTACKLPECYVQTWISQLEQVHPMVEDESVGDENQVEATLGDILIKRIVEKTRRGSHMVREAQTVLATLDGDDAGEKPARP